MKKWLRYKGERIIYSLSHKPEEIKKTRNIRFLGGCRKKSYAVYGVERQTQWEIFQNWREHFIQSGRPFIVTRNKKGCYSIYKEDAVR